MMKRIHKTRQCIHSLNHKMIRSFPPQKQPTVGWVNIFPNILCPFGNFEIKTPSLAHKTCKQLFNAHLGDFLKKFLHQSEDYPQIFPIFLLQKGYTTIELGQTCHHDLKSERSFHKARDNRDYFFPRVLKTAFPFLVQQSLFGVLNSLLYKICKFGNIM